MLLDKEANDVSCRSIILAISNDGTVCEIIERSPLN